MAICSYLVIPARGAAVDVAARLSALPGCEVVRAENRELLILLTESGSPEEEESLRQQVEAVDGIHALILTFGDIDPETPVGDPVKGGKRRHTAGGSEP